MDHYTRKPRQVIEIIKVYYEQKPDWFVVGPPVTLEAPKG